MSKLDAALTQGARSLGDKARKALVDHPDADTLQRYDARQLPEDESVWVRRHLVACRECTRRLLDRGAATQQAPPSADDDLTPEERDALWEGIDRRLTEEGLDPAATALPHPAAPYPRWLPAAAGLLLVLSAALGAYSIRAHLRLALPQGRVQVVDLSPVATTRGQPQAALLTPGMEEVTLLLSLADLRPFARYRAELRRGSRAGEVMAEAAPLLRDPQGSLSFRLRRRDLPQGPTWIHLLGIDTSGGEETLAWYAVQFEEAPPP